MPKTNMNTSSVNENAWNQIEDVGIQIGMVRNAMQVANWAIAYQDGTVGGIGEEMADFFCIVDSYLGGMEHKCATLCAELLEEKKSREAVA